MFATVAVDQPLDAVYTYSVPDPLRRDIQAGSRVTVPLGRGNRITPATVLELSAAPPQAFASRTLKVQPPPAPDEPFLFDLPAAPEHPAPGIKPLAGLLRDVAPVPRDLLDLARWISAYYCAPIGMTLATMVPAAVKRATRLPANMLLHLADAARPPAEQLAGLRVAPRTRRVFEGLHAFLQDGPRPEAEVLTHAGIGRPLLKRLLALGLLLLERQIQTPEPLGAHVNTAQAGSFNASLTLTPDQQTALAEVNRLLDSPAFAVRLVHGVTGSGKTEVYIRAIEKIVARGQRAIVLVPEISLTPQTVRRFTARFPRVAVLHSGLKDSQRHQHWHAIATGWAQVIVGARSAIFAPAANLGLIVVDEEHDPSYKQDSLPKYHGRDVAIRRAQMLNIPVLLGSATPALESWHNARNLPRWGLLSLRSRPLNTQMPRVVIVDMKAQAKERRGLHILSTVLEHHLRQTLEAKKQAIFLLNRRGYAHYVMCPRCDWVLMCDNCDATMVVHRQREGAMVPRHEAPAGTSASIKAAVSDSLGPASRRRAAVAPPIRGTVQCHYCLTAKELPALCPLCKARLTHLGQGTQRAEDELLRKFPSLRLKRMDSDSMRDAADYQESLDAFGNGGIDLLIGTQMISKGLDFPNVNLVGVLNSDLAMTLPDFRAAERTFQLICQVAGRSGRAMGGDRGTVIVQTFQPAEPAIATACNHDYTAFVESELPHRKDFGYPPFGRLVRIVLAHKSYTTVHAQAEALARLIAAQTHKLNLPIRLQGPVPPPMQRLMEQYRVELILFADTAVPLQRLLASLRSRGALAPGKTDISVDVDPLHLL